MTMIDTTEKHGNGIGIKGTVMSLNPSKPLTCSKDTTVEKICDLMAKTKENCVLVVDGSNEELLGIFTAKDIAFRVVSSKLNVSTTTVDKIMTLNPMCAKINTKANDALMLMVMKKFRHLPIVNENNQITGVLDITKCYLDSMQKLERLYENSKNIYNAMETVNKELGGSKMKGNYHNYIITYFESLKKILSGPRLKELINDDSTIPIYCDQDKNIFQVSNLMKHNKKTAVLIREEENIIGIFTSKDIVSRVIGCKLDPYKCKVKDVMTRNPSIASDKTSINAALKKMFDGKYLNLPVTNEESNEIVGIVDVIRLTTFTLKQIQAMESFNEDEEEEEDDDDFNNFLSGFDGSDDDTQNKDNLYELGDVSMDEMSQFDIGSTRNQKKRNSFSNSRTNGNKQQIRSICEVNYNEICFFKIKFLRNRTKMHRISFKPSEGIAKLDELLKTEFPELKDGNFEISYYDEDKDLINISTDKDLQDCVLLKKNIGLDKIEILIHDLDDSGKGKVRSRKNVDGTSNNNNSNNNLVAVALFTLAGTIAVVFALSRRR